MTTPEKLPFREKFCYGFGDLASVLYWQTFMVGLTYFYTDVFGLSALAAGTMLGLSRSMDAFFDPVMGMIADRTETRWGKFRPYLLWFCVPFAITGVFTFTTPNFTDSGKLVWAWITYNALMLLYTAINIPYTAMLGVLTPNTKERTSLSSIKFIFAYVAGALISITLLPTAKVMATTDASTLGLLGKWAYRMGRLLGVANEREAWQMIFVIIGVAAVVFFLITFFNTRERVRPPVKQKSSVWDDLGDLLTNGPWFLLLATTITFILFVAVRSSITIHYFKYFVGTQTVTLPAWLPGIGGTQAYDFTVLSSVFNFSGQVASALGVFLIPFLAGRFGKRTAFIAMLLVAIGCTGSFYLFKPDQLGLILGLNLIGSLTGGPLSALLWAMYADTADYAEWKKGRRATGLIFSASIFSQKQGWAFGAWLALGLMASVGFKANITQTPETLKGLLLLVSLIPAALGLLAIGIVLFYPLTEAKMSQIGAELKARREKEASGGPAPA